MPLKKAGAKKARTVSKRTSAPGMVQQLKLEHLRGKSEAYTEAMREVLCTYAIGSLTGEGITEPKYREVSKRLVDTLLDLRVKVEEQIAEDTDAVRGAKRK